MYLGLKLWAKVCQLKFECKGFPLSIMGSAHNKTLDCQLASSRDGAVLQGYQ